MKLQHALPSFALSLLGLIVMFGLTRNRYAWMSEALESSEELPVDENSALKTAIVVFAAIAVAALNVRVLRRSEGWGLRIVAILLLAGTALALLSFFFG